MALGTQESSFDFTYFSFDLDNFSFDIIIFSFDFSHFSFECAFFLRICPFFYGFFSWSRPQDVHASPPPTHLGKFLKSLTLHNRHLPLGTPIIWGGVTSRRSLWLNKRGGGTTTCGGWTKTRWCGTTTTTTTTRCSESLFAEGWCNQIWQSSWQSGNLAIWQSRNLAIWQWECNEYNRPRAQHPFSGWLAEKSPGRLHEMRFWVTFAFYFEYKYLKTTGYFSVFKNNQFGLLNSVQFRRKISNFRTFESFLNCFWSDLKSSSM